MTDIFVDPGEMRAHANRVRSLSRKAGEATAAAGQVSFTSGMFGSIGSLLVGPAMFPLQTAGQVAAAAMEGALDDCAETVTGLADTFSFIDDTVGAHFDEIGRRIR
ncbi:enamine deaminase RidA (YjgF/YER057c/UK114 family) [Nocardioides cavernae]|uniref:Enamine deaminase RidA (YjgF/YER057c/UK114 family) n=1 Tax=Nocardioides cavernae TaxID=1921566 RepID=A0A7Y9KR66_9ACTN|nr:type VII secretion target [Nocardioides cavernae]NYE36280.1 enamine deaminase RidA (YjgF/YER057c/UK114 family) [Nocardioides cavernae]